MALANLSITRVFTADKTVKSPGMNRLGVQVARMVLARMVYRARRPRIDASVRDDVATLQRDGMLVIPNFLPESTFLQVRDRAAEVFERNRDRWHEVHHGPNTLHVLSRRELPLATELPEFFAHPRLAAILESVERRPGAFAQGHHAIERLEQGPDAGHDPETDLHSDIFFTTHKAWLYLSDVTLESGPLVFVKRSHLLSAGALRNVYRESCASNTGSRRISPQELQDLHLEETVMTCPANTLAIANTFGYHRRLRGAPGHTRFAVHVSLRGNPFFWWR